MRPREAFCESGQNRAAHCHQVSAYKILTDENDPRKHAGNFRTMCSIVYDDERVDS